MPATPPIFITTLVIGADYRKSLELCLKSKVEYAQKHNYTYVQGDEKYWDRHRPISWSKIALTLDVCSKAPEGALIWQSDADVLITNQDLKIEEHLAPLLPEGKDFLMVLDACGHINAGNILFRNTEWARDFWRRVDKQKEFTYHIWWENAAILKLMSTNPEDLKKIHVIRDHKKFNAYIQGIPDEPLWQPGDFLVHFAGIYDLKKMKEFAEECLSGKVPRISLPPADVAACKQSRQEYLKYVE
jgi:hypothetical protein